MADLLGDQYHYDPATARYVDASGKPVPEDQVKRSTLAVAAAAALAFSALTDELLSGAITAEQWQERFIDRITSLHAAMITVAAGGFDRLSEDHQRLLSGILDYQHGRFDGFAQQVQDKEAGSADAIRARAKLYGTAANGTYEAARRISAGTVYFFERNNLSPVEHCEQCLAETARGWVSIGALSLPGTRTCKMNCACWLSYALFPVPDESEQ